MASARSSARLPIVARRARAARARGAPQVHRLHEGEGAPRVARPVQALEDPVRPAPPNTRTHTLAHVYIHVFIYIYKYSYL